MFTIINGTNRPQNQTQLFSSFYYNYLKNRNVEVQYFSMEQLPADFLHQEIYGNRTPMFDNLIEQYIIGANKFVFFLPEYNGSYAGITKLFVDAVPPKFFRGKKAAIIGISDGRAGNLMGIDHFTAVLNHVGILTSPQRLPISRISELLKDRNIVDDNTIKLLQHHADNFVLF